ncbi:hypothetical protein TgHK011_000785 [Trichoderma gracile]|nr:hypothetical protein TgHK011_000785 [Trichoderma gracile]
MSAQQANLNLQYQQQLQQQHEQQQLQQQQQHNAQQLTQQHQQQQQQQQQQQRRKKTAQQPAKKKTYPTIVSPGMRDRQARGKNTHRKHEDDATDDDDYDEDDDDEKDEEDEQFEGYNGRERDEDDDDDEEEEDSEDEKTNSSSFTYRSEPFETRERRAYALAVLDRPEQLMMYANTTNDSVAGQRVRFTRMMCGFDDETDWRNNLHYRAALAAAKERQIKVRRGASLPRDF